MNQKKWEKHQLKIERIQQQFEIIRKNKNVSLKPKATTHFFRVRKKRNTLDMRSLNEVIDVDAQQKVAYVEGCTSFYTLAKETLKHNLLPAVTPEMRSITIGGTISGLGVEASSFQYGFVHNMVLEYTVLTGNGEIITCSPSENADLFYALPNSLGTIGYVLRCKIKLMEAHSHVKLTLTHYPSPQKYFAAMKQKCDSQQVDFIEGYIDSSNTYVLIEGVLTNEHSLQQTYDWQEQPFWQFLSTAKPGTYVVTTHDFLWRWDRDCFWTLRNLGVVTSLLHNTIVRKLFGSFLLRSDLWVYLNTHTQRIRESKWYKKLKAAEDTENVLQDFLLDLNECTRFFEWYTKKVGIFPVWICPIRNDFPQKYPMHELQGKYVVDICIYSGRKKASHLPPTYYNDLLDEKILSQNGFKGLYSTTFVSEKQFWSLFDKKKYFTAKEKYDTKHIFPDVFRKAVGSKTL